MHPHLPSCSLGCCSALALAWPLCAQDRACPGPSKGVGVSSQWEPGAHPPTIVSATVIDQPPQLPSQGPSAPPGPSAGSRALHRGREGGLHVVEMFLDLLGQLHRRISLMPSNSGEGAVQSKALGSEPGAGVLQAETELWDCLLPQPPAHPSPGAHRPPPWTQRSQSQVQ